MNSLRKVLGFFVAAMMFAVFAPPSSADSTTKSFNATFPSAIQNGTQVITVQVNNTTPGVSTINSVQFFPAPNVTMTTAVTPGTGVLQGGSLIVTGFPGIKTQKSLTFTLTVIVNTQVCAQALWPKPIATAGSSGDPFQWSGTDAQLTTAFGPCDNKVACGASFTDGNATVTRGVYNKDGSTCLAAWYNSTTDLAHKKVSLQVDPNQPAAVFVADITWNPDFVDPATGLPRVTQVAWQLDVNQNPIYFPGRFCISPDLPAPYAILTADVPLAAQGSTSTLSVNTANGVAPLPPVPFPIIIDTERLLVTDTSAGTSWQAVRGAGNTTPAAHSKFYANTSVPKNAMSTPFPLDGSGTVMQVCIALEDNETLSPDQCGPVTPTQACVQTRSTVFGDYFVAR